MGVRRGGGAGDIENNIWGPQRARGGGGGAGKGWGGGGGVEPQAVHEAAPILVEFHQYIIGRGGGRGEGEQIMHLFNFHLYSKAFYLSNTQKSMTGQQKFEGYDDFRLRIPSCFLSASLPSSSLHFRWAVRTQSYLLCLGIQGFS